MTCVSIREYDHLLPAGSRLQHPRARTISRSSFEALLRGIEREADAMGPGARARGTLQGGLGVQALGQALRPSSFQGRASIQAQSFAGVIRTPDGTEIEILPKVVYLSEAEDKLEDGRSLLIKMLRSVPDMDFIDPGPAGLQLRNLPLLEFFISQLLRAVSHVVHRGIRHDYTTLAASEPFIRGRLLFAEQVRHNLSRQHLCHNEHDQFLPDCAENRLLRTALRTVQGLTRSNRNQQLARELEFCFDDVPVCLDPDRDLQKCRRDPSMSHYRRALAWAALILERLRPSPAAGRREVQSLLFAMEDLFECYVYRKLREKYHSLDSSIRVRKQLQSRFLVKHLDQSMFRLKPDLSLDRSGASIRILDTKWKILDTLSADARRNKYGVSQADIYQLFAYGRKYLREQPDKVVCLIYPRTSRFKEPLPHFEIEPDLLLHILPFDIERGVLLELELLAPQ